MNFALVLDILITFLLAGTIYFVWRLSEQMARFKNSRADMDRLIRDLNNAVDRAQQSIVAMRGAADTSGQELQKIMRGATELSDELQLMTESANSLATRLERAAGQNSVSGQTTTSSLHVDPRPPMFGSAPAAPASFHASSREATSFTGFAIRDPEFDGTVEPDDISPDWVGGDDDRSQAEKDLARALQNNKKSPRSVI